MIVNAYVVLTALVALAEVLLGAALAAFAVRSLTRGGVAFDGVGSAGAPGGADSVSSLETASPLLAATASRLLVATVASGVLLFLVLRSFVPQWPGVMCIQGVLRVGSHDLGAAGWLPGLTVAIAVLTTATVLATGAAVVVHGIDRETRTAPLAKAVAITMAFAGGLAVAKGVAVAAYLVIPKEKPSFASGCCTVDAASIGTAATPEAARTAWTVAFLAIGAATALAASWASRDESATPSKAGVLVSVLGAAATAVTGGQFIHAALAPAVQSLPLHECVFCALTAAPETWVGVVAGAAGSAAVLFAGVAATCGRYGEAAAPAARRSVLLLRWGGIGVGASVLSLGVERWLA